MENENKLNYSMKRYRDKLKKQKKENNRYNKKYKKFKKHKKSFNISFLTKKKSLRRKKPDTKEKRIRIKKEKSFN